MGVQCAMLGDVGETGDGRFLAPSSLGDDGECSNGDMEGVVWREVVVVLKEEMLGFFFF